MSLASRLAPHCTWNKYVILDMLSTGFGAGASGAGAQRPRSVGIVKHNALPRDNGPTCTRTHTHTHSPPSRVRFRHERTFITFSHPTRHDFILFEWWCVCACDFFLSSVSRDMPHSKRRRDVYCSYVICFICFGVAHARRRRGHYMKDLRCSERGARRTLNENINRISNNIRSGSGHTIAQCVCVRVCCK